MPWRAGSAIASTVCITMPTATSRSRTMAANGALVCTRPGGWPRAQASDCAVCENPKCTA